MNAVHRQIDHGRGGAIEFTKVTGQQYFHRTAVQPVVDRLKGLLPGVGQVQRQDWLINLHPLQLVFCQHLSQSGQNLTIHLNDTIKQVQPVELFAFHFAQPEPG